MDDLFDFEDEDTAQVPKLRVLRHALFGEEAPCDGCKYRIYCIYAHKACWQYAYYVSSTAHDRWHMMDKAPMLDLDYAESMAMESRMKGKPEEPDLWGNVAQIQQNKY